MSNPFDSAMRLLVRREHSAKEILDKLKLKGISADAAAEALSECQRLNLQSDLRYAQAMKRHRAQQGYGPLRIRQELAYKGVSKAIIAEVLSEDDIDWGEQALKLLQKRNVSQSSDYQSSIKRKKLLMSRGFNLEDAT